RARPEAAWHRGSSGKSRRPGHSERRAARYPVRRGPWVLLSLGPPRAKALHEARGLRARRLVARGELGQKRAHGPRRGAEDVVQPHLVLERHAAQLIGRLKSLELAHGGL